MQPEEDSPVRQDAVSSATNENINATGQSTSQELSVSGVVTGSSAEPVKKRKKKMVLGIILVLLLVTSGATVVALKVLPRLQKKTVVQQIATVDNSELLSDRAFVRYAQDAAYEKDETGIVKIVTKADGSQVNIRVPSFTVEVDYRGQKRTITLDDKVMELGTTTKGEIYALSCDSIQTGAAGADNLTYRVTLYDKEAKQLRAENWKQRDSNAPKFIADQYCSTEYFNMAKTHPKSLDPQGYGQELVDEINYKIVYKKQDGTIQDIATENARVVDKPLGISPDNRSFLYQRVSAKRIADGCSGESINLPYKIADYSGSINELHAVDLETQKDTKVGAETSFGTELHPISLRQKGHFSADGARYYLREGTNHGCSGGSDEPIRIAYIDLRSNTFQTIESPEGKKYTSYCFTPNGKYVLETVWRNSDKYPMIAPSVLNTATGETYQHTELTEDFDCNEHIDDGNNSFIALDQSDLAEMQGGGSPAYKSLNSIKLFNPEDKKRRDITFDQPVDIENVGIEGILFIDAQKGALIRKNTTGMPTPDPVTGELRGDLPVIIFDTTTGRTAEAPYAQLVL